MIKLKYKLKIMLRYDHQMSPALLTALETSQETLQNLWTGIFQNCEKKLKNSKKLAVGKD